MSKEHVKILHIVTSVNTTGVSTLLYSYYTRMNHEKIHFDIVAIDCGYEQRMADEFRKEGTNVWYMPKSYLARVPFLYKLIRNNKYDVVHSHIELANAIYLSIASICGVRIRISHAHMAYYPYKGLTNCILKTLNKVVASQFWGCSKDALYNLYGHKIGENRGIVIYNAINLDNFSFSTFHRDEYRERWMIRENTKVFGFVGRFTAPKNVFFLLDVFETIHKMDADTILITVGEGELLDQFKEETMKKGLDKCIHNLGSRKDVAHIMSAMDALLLPSLYEGLGIVLVEAQACGLRCFASKEKIPVETNVSDFITYISIYDSVEKWGRIVLNNTQKSNRDQNMNILLTQRHYNINAEAPIVESKYIELTNEKKRR